MSSQPSNHQETLENENQDEIDLKKILKWVFIASLVIGFTITMFQTFPLFEYIKQLIAVIGGLLGTVKSYIISLWITVPNPLQLVLKFIGSMVKYSLIIFTILAFASAFIYTTSWAYQEDFREED